MVGLILMAIGFLVTMPMGDKLPDIAMSSKKFLHNYLFIFRYYLSAIYPLNGSQELSPHVSPSDTTLGCRYPTLKWCTSVPKLHLFQYILGAFIFTLGYPAAFVFCFTIFSKVLGPKPQVF